MCRPRPLDAPLLESTDPSLARQLSALIGHAREDALLAASELAAIPEAALTRPWAWIGGSEEEVRVEKTLSMLGHVPTEPERLTRLLLAAYGRAEATVFGRGSVESVESAAERVAKGAAEARDAIRAAREAGAAGGP